MSLCVGRRCNFTSIVLVPILSAKCSTVQLWPPPAFSADWSSSLQICYPLTQRLKVHVHKPSETFAPWLLRSETKATCSCVASRREARHCEALFPLLFNFCKGRWLSILGFPKPRAPGIGVFRQNPLAGTMVLGNLGVCRIFCWDSCVCSECRSLHAREAVLLRFFPAYPLGYFYEDKKERATTAYFGCR